MSKAAEILGMNARNALYSRLNPSSKRKYASSKLVGKKLLLENNIPTPQVLAVFANPRRIIDFSWEKLESFVLKPEGGNAGKGVLVVKKRSKWAGEWWTAEGNKVAISDLRLHALDILEGRYSTYRTKSRAFIEERVPIHPVFRKYTYRGTPDIRVVVFNYVPVMAMLRLPTRESEGRANLHQGAIGVGIDLATGITTFGFLHGQRISRLPGKKRKLNGFKIPQWKEILKTAILCQQVSGLGYLGVDLVIHPEKGIMVLELNANPGLSIQVANMTGLRRRLERVEGLEVRDAEHGVKICQALFGSRFVDKVKAEEGIKIVNFHQPVEILLLNKKKFRLEARVDTSRARSAISHQLAEQLGLLASNDILWQQKANKEKVPVIEVTFYLRGRETKTIATVLKALDKKPNKLVLGRNDLAGFLIRVDEEM